MNGVGDTAFSVAAARAIHTSQDLRLISDPFAASFVRAVHHVKPMPTSLREAHELFPGEQIWLDSPTYIGVRTRVFDDYYQQATADGFQQAVILAAGLDARAFRLNFAANTTVYEIDHPNVLQFKDATLAALQAQPRCNRRVVPVDLREDWSQPLLAAGFDPDQPTAWLAEGLLPYLPQQSQQQLVDTVHRLSADGSRWAIEATTSLAAMSANPEFDVVADESGLDARPLLHADERPHPADSLRAIGWTVVMEEANAAAQRLGQEIGPTVRRIAELNQFLHATLGPA